MLEIEGFNPVHFWLRGEKPKEPVCFDEDAGIWHVYGHPEASSVLLDPKVFSSNALGLRAELSDISDGMLPAMDGPEHGRLRKLAGQVFTAGGVRGLAAHITQVAGDLLDKAAERDRFDLVADFSRPLPVAVITNILGVPATDRPLVDRWMSVLLGNDREFSMDNQSDERRNYEQHTEDTMREMRDYFICHAKDRRTQPRDDLLSTFANDDADGRRLTDMQIGNLAWLLLVAGHVTTMLLVANTMLCLDRHPDQYAMVRADRELLPGAIEESLRMLSPNAVVTRRTTVPTILDEHPIDADQLLMVWIAATNRDDRIFDAPDDFDILRSPNPHLAFASGVHRCLGAPLARTQGKIALNLLLDRFPHLHLDPATTPKFIPSPEATGVTELQVLTHP